MSHKKRFDENNLKFFYCVCDSKVPKNRFICDL